MSSFSDRAWAATAELRRAIDELAFLTELGEGTLAPAVFRHYLEQDALYLGGYARALALLAARAPDPGAAAFWAGSAQNCGVVETQLHADLLSTDLLGSAGAPPARPPEPSPTCLGYTSYLVATAATAPYAVAAAAVLPCYWVYADVGARLAPVARAAADHPYRRWVATYDAEPFQLATARARALTDAAAEASPAEEPAMLAAFTVAARYELEFWRAAHVRESWAPAG
ncbi:TenA family protein [Blastococcus xanthinilyticus]|uniref:Thiaminase /4-amino-5-aminomethyl-2-methylpyrimidine deaminase n=1 Tax=Blastococcus xanthinilyticus TaxID=1564164 RepID=A0A5S5CV12_9ACTN|nr:TenA family protein [Blastococcus xanthinilyticus]TYP86412.1 thiaminase /4-amino-5-aminomethyl-2-methylpyrimidine deaminase [Blastococcus xanthinilyticus]